MTGYWMSVWKLEETIYKELSWQFLKTSGDIRQYSYEFKDYYIP